MVTRFVELAATKGKKKGPHGAAQVEIKKAVATSNKLKKRKKIGRRTGTKKNRQQRDVVKLIASDEDVVGKLLYFNFQTDVANSVFQKFNKNASDVVEVSDFNIYDCKSNDRSMVFLDQGNDDNFICAKLSKNQANECMGGIGALNTIRKSFNLMKKLKPNQDRGKKTKGLSKSYKIFGHRKDQTTKLLGEYICNKLSNISDEICKTTSEIYCNLSYKMEKGARRIGNSLFETGVYEEVQIHAKVPRVAKDTSKKGEAKAKKSNGLDKFGEIKKKDTIATALAVAENYWSFSHVDQDFYFTALSVMSRRTEDNGKVLQYFIFPKFKLMIPMRTGDILLFNPTITHSCSNPSLPDTFIFSSYCSNTTVLTAESNRLAKNLEIDEIVKNIMS